MITIQFRDKKEAVIFFQLLNEYHNPDTKHVSTNIIYEPEVLVKINFSKSFESIISTVIIPVLLRYIIKVVEVKWMKEMIRNMFYFTDEEEQRQIMSIARSIIDGEKQELPISEVNKQFSREKMIESALKEFLTPSISFSFESFLQFRLKDYRFRLIDYIEAAIDEYKLEQEYQNFVENLRRYVYSKDSLMEEIHIIFEDEFYFFDRNYNEISKEQLKYIVDESITQIEDIDTESLVIAPLISIAPKTIYLYTNKIDNGLVQTIQNIFLERVILRANDEFQQNTGHMPH